MLKSEMISKWDAWERVLDTLEKSSESKVDMGQIAVAIGSNDKPATEAKIRKVANELFRIISGMTSGSAKNAVVQAGQHGIVNALRRMIAKGKSRTSAAIRELKQRVNNPTKVSNLTAYEGAVTEWNSNVEQLISNAGQQSVPKSKGLIDTYMELIPPEAKQYALIHIDHEDDPEKFRADVETHINRLIRDSACANTAPITAFRDADKEPEIQDAD